MTVKKKPLEESILWQSERNGIRCLACARSCWLAKNSKGFCQVRENSENKLLAQNFGRLCFLELVDVETLPLFHYLPGSQSLKLACLGTNFKGELGLSEGYEKKLSSLKEVSPESVVEKAEKKGAKSIAYLGTLESEPFVYPEFVFRCSKLAFRSNIKNVFVTNAYGNNEAIKKLGKYLDAALLLFYASGNKEFYREFAEVKDLEAIFETILQLRKQRMFFEVVNFVFSEKELEDCEQLAHWIVSELGGETPFHLLRLPHSGFEQASQQVLERLAEVAKKVGLRYVYLSQFEHQLNNTYCYNCQNLLVERKQQKLKKLSLVNGRCGKCGFRMNAVLE